MGDVHTFAFGARTEALVPATVSGRHPRVYQFKGATSTTPAAIGRCKSDVLGQGQ